MKVIALLLFVFVSLTLRAQTGNSAGDENKNLKFDSLDLKIIQRADAILFDSTTWNKQDERECTNDIANGKYSLYCALYKASVDIAGVCIHRRSCMQVVRFTVEKYEQGRVIDHGLMNWNNHPATTFAELKKVLSESIESVRLQMKQ